MRKPGTPGNHNLMKDVAKVLAFLIHEIAAPRPVGSVIVRIAAAFSQVVGDGHQKMFHRRNQNHVLRNLSGRSRRRVCDGFIGWRCWFWPLVAIRGKLFCRLLLLTLQQSLQFGFWGSVENRPEAAPCGSISEILSVAVEP